MKYTLPGKKSDDRKTTINKNYLCCCNSIHVKTGVQIILGICVFRLVFLFIEMLVDYSENKSQDFQANLIVFLVHLPFVLSLDRAIRTESKWYLVPFIILQVLFFLLFGVAWIAFCFMIFSKYLLESVYDRAPNKEFDDFMYYTQLVSISATAFLTMCIFLILWSMDVVFKFFWYCRDQEEAKEKHDISVVA